MTPQQKADAEQRAKAYIDKIIRINREHGMGNSVSEDTYRRAVDGSARVFRSLIGHPSTLAGADVNPHADGCCCDPCWRLWIRALPRRGGPVLSSSAPALPPAGHGTRSGYNAGCREECCRVAQREYQRWRRRR